MKIYKTKVFFPKSSISPTEIQYSIKWLAHFHGKFLHKNPDQIWQIGTYWHLETRPDEFNQLQDIELKNAAAPIDKKLNSAKFKTLVHGDSKLANFLFNDHCAAAVDFQYVGSGVGVKDLAYFLSSVYNESELFQYEKKCLEFYFNELQKALNLFHPKTNSKDLVKEWNELYPFAWCDFYRFLQGWSPDHPKINRYSEQMKNKVLRCL